MRTLVAIPVFNEQRHVRRVLAKVRRYADDVLVIDDGSTDATPDLLEHAGVEVIRHERNLGYGRSLRDAFALAADRGYDWIITMDCDEQHEPEAIPRFVARAAEGDCDIVSGSRYLHDPIAPKAAHTADDPPPDRRAINETITAELNERLGFDLTDAFCGFKAHRVAPLAGLGLDEDGYAFPMQLWARAAAAGLRISEAPVRRIYHDPSRSFGGALDDPQVRLAHYRQVLHCELERVARMLPAAALEGVSAGCGS